MRSLARVNARNTAAARTVFVRSFSAAEPGGRVAPRPLGPKKKRWKPAGSRWSVRVTNMLS